MSESFPPSSLCKLPMATGDRGMTAPEFRASLSGSVDPIREGRSRQLGRLP